MILTGGCLCGGVRWRAESAAPPPVVACHCEDFDSIAPGEASGR